MTVYAGFDMSVFPGAAQMSWLIQNTNLRWCGFYLGPAPSHTDDGWMDQRAALAALGWGLLPIYLGQQTAGPGAHSANPLQGSLDGTDAATLASGAGFPPGTYVYLDVEDGSAPSEDVVGYIHEWAHALVNGGYAPGFYCSHLIADAIASAVNELNPMPNVRFWPFKVATTAAHAYAGDPRTFSVKDPSGCGFSEAFGWQYEQNAQLQLKGTGSPHPTLVVDLSTAQSADPGAP